jgi:hypothetical protein
MAKRTEADQRAAFVARANRTTTRALNAVQRVGGLTGTTDADKTKILEALKKAIAEVEGRLSGKVKAEPKFDLS